MHIQESILINKNKFLSSKNCYDVGEMITVKHKIQRWNLPTLVSWDRASYLSQHAYEHK